MGSFTVVYIFQVCCFRINIFRVTVLKSTTKKARELRIPQSKSNQQKYLTF